jgi:quercetin dioxygenase-like cupin family protein
MEKENRSGVTSFRVEKPSYRWDEVDVTRYNASGTTSRDITKQILFHADSNLGSELRYFEALPGGYSALETHQHVHAVLILRGRGRVLVGDSVTDVQEHDLVYIPPNTWHQFYAAADEPLGFLCLVNGSRDRPVRPSEEEMKRFSSDPVLKDVVRF